MYETCRRSAISTSELGLYSDRGERYGRSKYGTIVRKFVIVVMAVVAVVLAAIFVYDFASVASATSKVGQETKRIYILQNTLKKSGVTMPRRETITPDPPIVGTSERLMQDRSDHTEPDELTYASDPGTKATGNVETLEERPETRGQSLENFKHRKRILEPKETKEEAKENLEAKQFDNHAVVYRVRQRYKYPHTEDEFNEDNSRPTPFHFELKTPQPSSFVKRPKFPQLTQYRYPHASRNIQDIIKYLSNDPSLVNRGIKFTGVYVNPKKYDLYPEAGESMGNSERYEYQADGIREDEDEEDDYDYEENEGNEAISSSRYATVGSNGDPFYQYKPKHPTDVNLLAPSNVRFSPLGTQRYNPYHDPFYQRYPPNSARPSADVGMYGDNAGAYSNGNQGKRRKPKPFSVMLDIYPITDLSEQAPSKKASRPWLPSAITGGLDEQDRRRPATYTRGHRHRPQPPAQPIPLVAVPAGHSGFTDDEEKQQMVFHLNLYPKKRNNRNDIIQRSETMHPEDHAKFMHSVMSPFDAIAKHMTDHSAIEESKYEESELPDTSEAPATERDIIEAQCPNEDSTNSSDEERRESPRKIVEDEITSTESTDDFSSTKKSIDTSINVDTPEGFQAFADGLMSTE